MIRGDRRRAIDDLRGAGAITDPWRGAPLSRGARGWRWRCRRSRARSPALAEEERGLAWAPTRARAEGAALRAMGCRGRQRGNRAPAGVGETLRESPAALEQARSLAELGAALRRGNRRSEARGRLREAPELAQRCAAERLETRVQEELRVAGAKLRRRATRDNPSPRPSGVSRKPRPPARATGRSPRTCSSRCGRSRCT